MKNFTLLLLGLMSVFFISCDKNDDTPKYTIDSFTGSWEAISATYTNNANPSEEIEIISKGADITFTMLAGGGARTWFTFGTYHDEWDALVEMPDQSTLISTPEEIERGINTFTFKHENDLLTLTNVNDKFDFTLMNQPSVPATSVIIFTRK